MKVIKPSRNYRFAKALVFAFSALFALSPASKTWAQSTAASSDSETSQNELPAHVIEQFGERPEVPTGPVDDTLKQAMDVIFKDFLDSTNWGTDESIALTVINESGDPRMAWLIADMMRFVR